MRKKLLLLLLIATVFSLSASGQIKKHPQLQKENVDFKSITDSNYALYKLVTTVPLSPLREIDPKYVLKDFNWDNLLKTNYDAAFQLGTLLNDSLMIREPKPGENPNFIYLTASIPNNLLPLMMMTKESGEMSPLAQFYYIKKIKNLYDLEMHFVSYFVDSSRKPIKFGRAYEVITSQNLETEVVDFTIALELLNAKFTDISSGNIETSIGGFKGVEKTIIKKSDVGKGIRFCNSTYDVLAFENGVLHLRYEKNFEEYIDQFRNDFRFVGNIDGNKFHIRCNYHPLLYAAYVRYREKPKLSLDEFQKYINPTKKVNVDIDDMKYGVMIYCFGYEMDSLNLYVSNKVLPTNLQSAISLRKNGENYSFHKIFKKKNMVADKNYTNDYIEKVKEYFRVNVKYPTEAMEKGIYGEIIFKFMISPDGSISDCEIIESPDPSFSQEILRVATRAPKFKVELKEKVSGAMSLIFKL